MCCDDEIDEVMMNMRSWRVVRIRGHGVKGEMELCKKEGGKTGEEK